MDGLIEDLIYDVGLHLGEDTAYYLAKGYRVVAFEAHPGLVQQAEHRFADALAGGRLEIVQGAITRLPGDTATFYVHSTVSEWGTIYEDWVARNERLMGGSESIRVPNVDFAATLRRTGVPAFMKVDIEGADTICLETLHDFATRPRYVSIESSQRLKGFRRDLMLLHDLGYDEFAIRPQAKIGGSTIETVTRAGSPLRYQFEFLASGGFGADIEQWTDLRGALRAYRIQRVMWAAFGDWSPMRRSDLGNLALSRLSELIPIPFPDWYDTHAKRRV
jgi:FkbM family methyltransferase